jgi:predicted DNA binding CopG/RHH family protein
MKYYDIDKNEEQILTDFDEGKLKSVKGSGELKKKFTVYAKRTLGKAKNINIRLTEKDILKLKAKAVADGMPYQTLAASILHRFAAI